MALKSQDVVVALKLLADGGWESSYAVAASQLGMSASEVHAAVGRLREGGLVDPQEMRLSRKAFRDFLVYGIRCVFPAKEGEMTRGMPTAWGMDIRSGQPTGVDEAAPVWVDPLGTSRGPSVEPIYKSVPVAARNSSELYRLLALVDTLRLGRARERTLAIAELDRLTNTDG